MRVGLFTPLLNPFATPEYVQALATAVEDRGFASMWVPEHALFFDEYESKYPYAADGLLPTPSNMGMFEPWTTLSFLAGITSTVRLGTGICLVPQRNPVYLAKEVATVDWLSGGRVDLGIGVGWLAEEFAALDANFADRGARTDAYIEVMRTLWCDEVSEYHGEHYDLPPSRCHPKPVQRPHPPILVGGESPATFARIARVGQGWVAFSQTPDQIAAGRARISALLIENNRGPDETRVVACPYMLPSGPDVAKAYRDAGVDELVLILMAPTVEMIEPALDAFADTYLTLAVTG